MIAKALDNIQISNLIKKGILFGIDPLKISAKVRLFSESTKENRKYLYFLLMEVVPEVKERGL